MGGFVGIFFPATAEFLLRVVTIPCYDRAYLNVSSNYIYLSENTQYLKIISALFKILQQNGKLHSHNYS